MVFAMSLIYHIFDCMRFTYFQIEFLHSSHVDYSDMNMSMDNREDQDKGRLNCHTF